MQAPFPDLGRNPPSRLLLRRLVRDTAQTVTRDNRENGGLLLEYIKCGCLG